jgi:hypothetical protein
MDLTRETPSVTALVGMKIFLVAFFLSHAVRRTQSVKSAKTNCMAA